MIEVEQDRYGRTVAELFVQPWQAGAALFELPDGLERRYLADRAGNPDGESAKEGGIRKYTERFSLSSSIGIPWRQTLPK